MPAQPRGPMQVHRTLSCSSTHVIKTSQKAEAYNMIAQTFNNHSESPPFSSSPEMEMEMEIKTLEPSNKHGKRILTRNSNSHISMSDTESNFSQPDSWHSPLQLESPLRSDEPSFPPENDNPGEKYSKALVLIDNTKTKHEPCFEIPAPVVVEVNKLVKEEPPPAATKVGGGRQLEEAVEEIPSRSAALGAILRRSRTNTGVKRAALGLRVFEAIACLVSFSVMAADKTQGWSGDSFDRYIEYRYCLAVNVIGFVYSGFQAFDLAYDWGMGKQVFAHHLRRYFDFAGDQILSYLLISASSSAATRVQDWISNWGGDEFMTMASASIAISFLAFISFASSTLISGYRLCNKDNT